MKQFFVMAVAFFFLLNVCGQEANTTTEQQLENLANLEEIEMEDDTHIVQLEWLKKNPLNINVAGSDELKQLFVLTDLQIDNLLNYRRLLGKLVHVYELQAVPAWDSASIQKILPYVYVGEPGSVREKWNDRLHGNHSLLFRYAQVLEKAKGFEKPAVTSKAFYTGSKAKAFFRYQYNYKNLLQWGLLGDKDAGEPFFKNRQRLGFDFYSFHMATRSLGMIKTLVIGDFTINMGQGLIQWQNLAFKKSAGTLLVKRQAPLLRPYHASGEFAFYRGVGVTLQKSKWELSGFASRRKISAALHTDTLADENFISSIITNGYHRTEGENDNRKRLRQVSVGGNINYRFNLGHIGINVVHHHFSIPVQPPDEPYRLFTFRGNTLTNASLDFSFTKRNMHFFGEAAVDQRYAKAIISGVLVSAAATVDVALVYRRLDKEYQSINANAFTENSIPVNEKGFYAGITMRPFRGIRLDAYADVFRFPWLKYRVSAPSGGKEFLLQATYLPDKQLEVYLRYRYEIKQLNNTVYRLANEVTEDRYRQNIRCQTNWRMNNRLLLRNRVELVWYNKKTNEAEQGFITYLEGFYQPEQGSFEWNARLQYVETDGYDSRIYAYENDVLYSYSIPAFFDKGFKYYVNVKGNWRVGKNHPHQKGTAVQCWLRWSQSIYNNRKTTGTGLDEIMGNKKTEIKLQCLFSF
jgi:hypothetical protein